MRFAFAFACLCAVLLCALPTLLAGADLLTDPAGALSAVVDPVYLSRLGTSFLFAALVLSISLPLGLLLAWLLVRTGLPWVRLWTVLMPLPMFLSPLVHALSWAGWLQLSGAPALVLVHTLVATPFVMLLTMRPLEQIGRAHMETVLLLGGRRAVFFDELRQAWPGALAGAALALVFLLADFAVADFLTSVGPKITVAADTIYAHHQGLRAAEAAGVAIPLLAPCLFLLLFALKGRHRLGTAVGQRFDRAPRLHLGRFHLPALLLVVLSVLAGAVLPFVSLMVQTGSVATFVRMVEGASDRIWFTVLTGAAAATGIVILSFPLALRVARRRSLLLDLLVFVPLATPPLTFGIGLIRMWNQPGLDLIYTGAGVVILATVGRYLTFGYLPISGALARVDPALEDAARLAGAGAFDRVRFVLWPLVRGPVVAAWCVTFAFSLRELDTLIMLRAGQSSLSYHLYANVVFARQDEVAALALLCAVVGAGPLLLYSALARSAPRLV